MGAYLSEPKTNKDSSDFEGNHLRCGASSMQGWRTSQEDAHNCIIDFDEKASLFAVYDGHGGHEVAEYCSKMLPNFIKQTESYLKGDYEQALKDAFLGFDELLTTPDVLKELKQMVVAKIQKSPNTDAENGSASESEEAIDNLVQEANMPLDEVMAKYKGKLCHDLMGEEKPVSPMLRARRTPLSDGAGCSNISRAGPSCSSFSEPGDAEVSSSSSTQGLCNGVIHQNGEVEDKTENEVESSEKCASKETDEKTESFLEEKRVSVEKCEADCGSKKTESDVNNGDSHDVSSSTENSNVTNEKCVPINSTSPLKKRRNIISSAEIYQKLLQYDSDSEEEDETFVAESEDGTSDDSADEGVENKPEDCEEASSVDDEDGGEEEEEENDKEEDDVTSFWKKEVPGLDSGSTAVVALLIDKHLYVANAGDSRCVVGRDGEALEMSFDHKPEDEPERKRIEGAGGIISRDGRVNNGLNLSRAIGDHSYKLVKELPASEQMITALPDVKTLTIDPTKDKFMVIACDGIWNSMTSQEVVSFVDTKLNQKTERLSQICEELFDHCLAPDTLGDGTGCDNMTCVIVQFKSPNVEVTSLKRPSDETEESSAKRSKVEEESAAS